MNKVMKISKKKNNFEEFLKNLSVKYDINKIIAEFSGSGDSGEINDYTYLKNTDQIDIDITEEEQSTIEEFFDSYLSSTNYDWYNDDGGFGDVTLNLITGEITCDMNINFTDSDNYQLSDEGDFIKNYKL